MIEYLPINPSADIEAIRSSAIDDLSVKKGEYRKLVGQSVDERGAKRQEVRQAQGAKLSKY